MNLIRIQDIDEKYIYIDPQKIVFFRESKRYPHPLKGRYYELCLQGYNELITIFKPEFDRICKFKE